MARKKPSRSATRNTATDEADIVISAFDGARRPISDDTLLLIRITDGFQKQLFRDDRNGPTITFRVPFSDNLADNYTVLLSADDRVDAGFTPVKVSPTRAAIVDLMLLRKNADFQFEDWETIKQGDSQASGFLSRGLSDHDAEANYDDLRQKKPASLAALLNLVTAMSQIHLPVGTPLDYFKELLWDETMAQDRFFAYVDKNLLQQVRTAVDQGTFKPEPGPGLFHPGATSSFKQIQFGEANVQLTFHEGDTKKIDEVQCIKAEPDIDYFKDLGAHALLEVIPNAVLHRLTDPRMVYVLRWIAGRHAGIPEFDPPYTLA